MRERALDHDLAAEVVLAAHDREIDRCSTADLQRLDDVVSTERALCSLCRLVHSRAWLPYVRIAALGDGQRPTARTGPPRAEGPYARAERRGEAGQIHP